MGGGRVRGLSSTGVEEREGRVSEQRIRGRYKEENHRSFSSTPKAARSSWRSFWINWIFVIRIWGTWMRGEENFGDGRIKERRRPQ